MVDVFRFPITRQPLGERTKNYSRKKVFVSAYFEVNFFLFKRRGIFGCFFNTAPCDRGTMALTMCEEQFWTHLIWKAYLEIGKFRVNFLNWKDAFFVFWTFADFFRGQFRGELSFPVIKFEKCNKIRKFNILFFC